MSRPILLLHTELDMFLERLLLLGLETEFALEGNTVLNQLFVLFKRSLFFILIIVFGLHLTDLHGQVLVHAKDFIIFNFKHFVGFFELYCFIVCVLTLPHLQCLQKRFLHLLLLLHILR